MKRTLLFILAFLPMLASADPVEIGGICYNLVEGTKEAEVTANLYRGDITIPESIEYEGITYSVTAIGESAFYYCTGLKSVTIPNSVATIGESAFDGCKNLSSVTIANGVTSIGVAAFQLCTSLTSLTIPNSVTAIAEGAFQGCSGLQSIVVDKGNTVYDSREDCNALIKTSDNKLITGCMNTTIPNSITAIGSWAFFLCDGLTSINIPNSVTGIEQSAFWGCKNLVSINIPNSVTEIEEQTFALCEALTSVTIPNSVTTIGDQAFSGCIGLTSVTIGSKVKTIGSLAFTDCLNLLDVYCYAEKVPETQNEVFRYANIENVTLHVPATSVSAYQAVEPWKNFKEIVALSENDTDDSDYLPFVELGKQWHVTSTASNPYNSLYCFSMLEEVERNGKTYVHTCYSDNEQKNHYYELLREENKRVYKYDDWEEKEYLVYDFSLKEGDTFTYELMTGYPEQWKVLKQGWLEDGPDIVSSCTSNPDGTLDIKYRKLRTWTVGREDDETGEYYAVATWVECVGALEGMFCQYCTGGTYYLSFVERAEDMGDNWENNIYLPFSFYNNNVLFKGNRVHGSNLPTGKAELSEDSNHQLTYELEGDRLHVYGKVLTHGGPNNYAYFFEETTDDNSVRKLHFNIIEIEPLPDPKPGSDGMLLHATDFYVPGFNPNRNYYVIDNRGVEHPVINKTPQMAYRPMIEDGKVWKVGRITGISDNPVKVVEYYYFDGDTIINGKTCKQMMCQRYINPDIPEYEYDYWTQFPSLSYVGAWYEEDKKVYLYDEEIQSMKIMYDFSLNENDIIDFVVVEIDQPPYLGPKQTGGIEGFKGVYRDLLMVHNVYNTTWLDGVGGIDGPTKNGYFGYEERPLLMSCTVGDEVIYLNDKYEDGATPVDAEAKKHRFDFTHTIKTKPKARTREDDAEPLYGEYNNQLLDIRLNPLDATYLVRITNESDQVVYEKTINAGSIVGLNIDISAFAKGRYTVTMENSGEVFTGEFETITTGIQELINEDETKNFNSSTLQFFNSIYNLQGQRLNRLQKGLNIVNGRKVFVK